MSNSETRPLHFDRIEDAIAEVDQLVATEVTTIGNYSFGQILEHLARTFDIVSGHTEIPFKPSLPMRFFARMMLPKILKGGPKPGFQLPSKAQAIFWPTEDVDVVESHDHFRQAVGRYQSTGPIEKHVFFGNMTRQQHDQLQCQHCALHLGFVKPVE